MSVEILISDRADFRARKVIKDKEGHYIILKGSVLEEDIIILNVYAFNSIVSKHVRQKLIELQGEKDDSTTTVGMFHTLLSEMDRSG